MVDDLYFCATLRHTLMLCGHETVPLKNRKAVCFKSIFVSGKDEIFAKIMANSTEVRSCEIEKPGCGATSQNPEISTSATLFRPYDQNVPEEIGENSQVLLAAPRERGPKVD